MRKYRANAKAGDKIFYLGQLEWSSIRDFSHSTCFLGLFLPPNYLFPPSAQEDQFVSLCEFFLNFLKQKAPFRTNFLF